MRESWIAVALALLCAASCPGCNVDADSEEPASGKSAQVERFVGLSNGVVRDTRTGLEWTSHDNDRDVTWHEAHRYCQALALGGQTTWRLPAIEELKGLYDERLDQPCGDYTCHLDPAVELTSPYYWSATQPGQARRIYFDFRFDTSLGPVLKPGLVRRALCVKQSVK